jgi:hypothetical protein
MGRNPTFGCWNDMNCMQPKPLIAGAMLALCACASNVAPPAAAGPPFQPIAFFEGRSHGDGELRKLFSSPVKVSVDSVGRMRNGTLVLDQTIRESGKPASTRRWIIVRAGPDRYSGTLTDAVGNVAGRVEGPRLYIRYTMKHGLTVQQHLAEQPDGRTILNRLVVSKLGVRVATLDETIRKLG